MTSVSVSVVVGVYNGATTLRELVSRLIAVLDRCTDAFEVILVDDGSRDDSAAVARQLQAECPRVRSLRLLRNYGQHNALLCGIRHASHEIVVTVDDDLQHPPEEIPRVLNELACGYDLVYAPPDQEQHGFLRDIASQFTKLAMQQMLGVASARQVSGFRAFRTQLRAAFEGFHDPFVNIDVMLTWATVNTGAVAVRHEPRRSGRSNYTFRRLVTHALNMLTGFTVLPLRVSSILGFLLTLFGIVSLGVVIAMYLRYGVVIPGFTFLASIIIIFSGTQLFALGVIGEYLARMHFRLLGRPAYVLRNDEPSGTKTPS
jgi:glycosyltransferase involved in cell wall biosynthesis